MAGYLRRPESKNDTIKRFICMQCRLHGNENDDTIVRDLAYMEARAREAVNPDMVDVLKEIVSRCMASCELNRYADRKNPCIFIYNVASMPAMRARNLWSEALELKDSKLLEMASPDKEQWKVSAQVTVLNVNYEKLKQNEGLKDKFKGLIREVLAHQIGDGVTPDNVEVDIWAGSVLYITIFPPPGLSVEQLQLSVSAAFDSTPRLNDALEQAFQAPGSELAAARTSGGEVHVGEVRRPPHHVSDRSEAIFKVCAHGAWLEQNTRDWDGAQGGTLTGAAWGYKYSMDEDLGIVEKYAALMCFDG